MSFGAHMYSFLECNVFNFGTYTTTKLFTEVPFWHSHCKCMRISVFPVLGIMNVFFFSFIYVILAINSKSSWFHFAFPWPVRRLNSFHVSIWISSFLKGPFKSLGLLLWIVLLMLEIYIYYEHESFIRWMFKYQSRLLKFARSTCLLFIWQLYYKMVIMIPRKVSQDS